MRPARLGFTIVELLVIVVALGLVAAVALPHFGQKHREQRIAKLQAAHGAVQSAAALMHGVARERHNQPQGTCAAGGFGANPPLINTAGNGNLCTENSRVQVALLYPAPTAAGIVASAGLVPVAGTPTATQLGHEGFRVAAQGSQELHIQQSGGSDAAQCAFSYKAPAALGEAPVISKLVTNGC